MSLEETKRLLRTHRITPNKLLGQNFMVDPSIYEKLGLYAEIGQFDTVLDAGAGFGFLSRFLADRCLAVVAVEKDPQIAEVLCDNVKGLKKVTVVVGDVLRAKLPFFNKTVAAPPYYLSSNLVTWLFERQLDCSVMILQKEFANRLVAPIGSEDYGWLTVLACLNAETELLDIVSRDLFFPQPEVDSIIVRLKPWNKPPFHVKDGAFFKQMVKWLFTQRNKKVDKALTSYVRSTLKLSKNEAEKLVAQMPVHDRRPRELSPKDFGAIENAIRR